MQFHLSFKGHKSLEYCCLVIHLTSVSIISYAESNGGIFVLIGRIKPEIRPVAAPGGGARGGGQMPPQIIFCPPILPPPQKNVLVTKSD